MSQNLRDQGRLLDTDLERLRGEFAGEANPPLLALQEEAGRQGVPFLWDDDAVSVGYGATAKVWTPDVLPTPDEVPWAEIGTIPVALVTGTNGKSTTVRMAAAILSAAGLRAGLTSTDWIRVGENILDTGDYSGTGGARTLLRHPDTQIAVLETARGGMLRRVPAERRFMLMSQAGDRLDGDIRDMTRAACGINPDRLFLCDLPGYERGRAPGEVVQVIRSAALSSGVAEDQISEWPNPRAAVAAALDAARSGDLLVLFVLTQRDEVLSMIHDYLDGKTTTR